MPYGFGPGSIQTSAGGDSAAGRTYTRIKGPLLVGVPPRENATNSNVIQPPHLANVSTARGDMLISVVSSFATGTATSSSFNVSTGAPIGLVYISQTTGSGNLIAAGSTANAPTGLPGGANGVALCWDSVKHTLAVYEPATSGWMWPHFPSTIGDTIVWSVTSS